MGEIESPSKVQDEIPRPKLSLLRSRPDPSRRCHGLVVSGGHRGLGTCWNGHPGRAAEVLGPRDRIRLTLRLLFHLPLRQAEGFLTSLFVLMGLDLRSPDHTTLSRRGQHLDLPLRGVPRRAGLQLIIDSTGLSIVGEGEWAAAKHGGRGTRGWKKLHLGVDPTGVIVAHALTDATVDDATTGVELIEAVNGPLTRVTADGAYDTVAFYDAAGVRARESWCRRPRRPGCLGAGHGRALVIARSPQCSASAGAGGRRRHATISKRGSRTPSSGTSPSSARGFGPGAQRDKPSRYSSRATSSIR